VPIYEYECGKCGVFEHSQRISEPALAKCPTCRRKVRRLISSTSFQLKGTGWYVTDYARNGGQKGDKDGGKDGEAAKSESKSDTASTSTTSESSSTKSEKSEKSKKSDTKAGASTPAKTAS
jgi:putative FmdB family regulatory protein